MPPWIFSSEVWKPQDHANVGKVFRRALKHAGLPSALSPHSLRHSYASLLLADGVSPAYVQEQLGHASISSTVGTYGRWLRNEHPVRSTDSIRHLTVWLRRRQSAGRQTCRPRLLPRL